MKAGITAISNPRTPDGGWKNINPCHACGKVSSAYVLIVNPHNFHVIKLCKGCLCDGQNKINKAILEQTEKRI